MHYPSATGRALGFEQTVTDVVSAVNFIRSHGLNHRHFKAFHDEIRSEYGDIVYYYEVSKGKVLQHFQQHIGSRY
jgi:hypothetical protein